jgi:hypothetical protein
MKTDFGGRLTKTNSEGRRKRTNSVLCCLLYITLGQPDRKSGPSTVGCYATNTGHLTVGCHATQQYRSGERIHVFDYGCLVTTDSCQTRHNIISAVMAVLPYSEENEQVVGKEQ